MTLPNLTLILSLISFVLAYYISFTEEEIGEDGLDLDSEQSETDPNATKPRFQLDESKDPNFVHPKYKVFLKWKWYTLLFQTTFVV